MSVLERGIFKPGETVTITEAPQELLSGLPLLDQRGIQDCVGQPGVFVGIDPYGYVEIEFSAAHNEFRTVFVRAAFVEAY